MHPVAQMLSKPSLFPSLSLSSLLFFFWYPSCALLPALISSPFHLGRGLRAPETKITEEEGGRSGNKEGMRRERRRGEMERRPRARLPYRRRCTHVRAHTGAIVQWLCRRAPVITKAETDERVAPLFLPRSSFHLLVSCHSKETCSF